MVGKWFVAENGRFNAKVQRCKEAKIFNTETQWRKGTYTIKTGHTALRSNKLESKGVFKAG